MQELQTQGIRELVPAASMAAKRVARTMLVSDVCGSVAGYHVRVQRSMPNICNR